MKIIIIAIVAIVNILFLISRSYNLATNVCDTEITNSAKVNIVFKDILFIIAHYTALYLLGSIFILN